MKNLNTMIENIRDEEKKKSAIIKENFQQLKEELKDKALEEMEIIQADMSSKKLGIYDALENLFQRFMRNSKDKFNKYTQLLEKNTNNHAYRIATRKHDETASVRSLH